MYNFLCQTSEKRKIIITSPNVYTQSPERIHKHFLNITSVNFDIFTNFLKQRMNQHSSFDSSKNVMTKCFCSKLNFKYFVEVIKKLLIGQFILLTRQLRSVYARSPWVSQIFFLAPNVYFTDRKVVNMAIFRVCQRGIWDHEREIYIFRCALLE